jgi:hypothetical protein
MLADLSDLCDASIMVPNEIVKGRLLTQVRAGVVDQGPQATLSLDRSSHLLAGQQHRYSMMQRITRLAFLP